MAKKIFNLRIWILVMALVISLIAINPNPGASGIVISEVESGSLEYHQGLSEGEKIESINNIPINTLADYQNIISEYLTTTKEITLETNVSIYEYNVTEDIGFIHDNLTILSIQKPDINRGEKILSINNKKIKTTEDFNEIINDLFPKQSINIKTSKTLYSYSTNNQPKISVSKAQSTNIKKGLELEGGTRALIKPISDKQISDSDIQNLIEVMENRLNVFGLSDIKIRSANVGDEKLVLIEISGTNSEEVKKIISKQGKFEAKIGEEIVFVGGNKDIPFVCRDDGTCATVSYCNQFNQQHQCAFQFAITLSQEASKSHAEVTKDLSIITDDTGGHLEKELDLYLDDILVTSLQISPDLRGVETNQISISGPGYGSTESLAVEDTSKRMNELQTVLITGSLPFKIEIAKLDNISPILGNNFIKNAFLVGFVALLAVISVVYFKYRRIKILIPMLITSLSELLIILGIASLIKWNLDVVAIAGIIAAIGTGVDHQIIIADEIISGESQNLNWSERIKRAFFIIMGAYATTIATMLPLWNAGAGLVRGFAVITIIGTSIGVFITRPAFAAIAEKLFNK
jgi:preprotein translocase subunit SecD